MPYRRCISTLGCPALGLEEILTLAAAHALDAVELRAVSGTIDVPAALAAAYGTPASLAERMRRASVAIAALDTSLVLAANTPEDRERFLAFVPWAEALGVGRLRVFDGGLTADPATHRAMAETVRWWRDQKQAHGWRADLMVETHDALCTAAAIQGFLAHAPGTAILWDTQHTWRNGGEDPVATWRAIAPHVVHIHVKDSVTRPAGRHPFTYVLPGEGEFPMPPLRTALAAQFHGVVSLEWERLWHPELEPLDAALDAATRRQWW